MAKTICIIDDEPDLAETCSNILTKEGYTVEVLTDAELGLKTVTSRNFDLILVDLMMPKVNGAKILQESKKFNPACHVIVFTGFPTIESAVAAMKDGAFDYLVKPFMTSQLVSLVAKALSGAKKE